METYSISFRVRRTTVEYGYVSVPVTEDVITQQPDGSGRLNVEKLVEQAIAYASAPQTRWNVEERQIEMHPLQKSPEPDEV